MAAGERTLKATIIGDAKGAEKAFAGVEKAAGGIGKALGVAALVGGVAIAGLGKAMFSFAQAAAEDERSVAKLRTAVENSGASWDAMRSGMEATVASAQKMAFTDDQARDALALLTAQTGSAEEAQKRFGLAMDLARGANIDVATASKLLGRVTEENVNVLGRYGLAVTEGTTETELFAMVQQRFGGQAAAFAGSTAGKFEVAKIRIQEAKEALGAQLLPVMAILANVLAQRVLPAIEGFVSKLSELSHLFQVGLGGGMIGGEFSAIEKAAFNFGRVMREDIIPLLRDEFIPNLQEVGRVLLEGATWLTEHKVALIAVGIALGVLVAALFPATVALLAISAALVALVTFWDPVSAKVKSFIETVRGLDVLGPLVEGIFNETVVIIRTALALIQKQWEFWKAIFTGDWDAAWTAVKDSLGIIWDAIGELVKNRLETLKQVVVDILPLIKEAFAAAWDGIKAGTGAALDALVGLLQGAAGKFRDAALALGGAIKDGFISGVQGIAERLGSVLSGAGDVAAAIARSVKNGINIIIDQINRLLEFSFTIPVPLGPDVRVGVNAPDIPHLAAGRRNFGGGLAMVGERGPELVALPRGSDVYSAGETRRLGSGAAIINLTVNVSQPLGTPQAIGEAIMRAVVDLQRSGRLSQITR